MSPLDVTLLGIGTSVVGSILYAGVLSGVRWVRQHRPDRSFRAWLHSRQAEEPRAPIRTYDLTSGIKFDPSKFVGPPVIDMSAIAKSIRLPDAVMEPLQKSMESVAAGFAANLPDLDWPSFGQR